MKFDLAPRADRALVAEAMRREVARPRPPLAPNTREGPHQPQVARRIAGRRDARERRRAGGEGRRERRGRRVPRPASGASAPWFDFLCFAVT